jgi:hypothetical protein
VAFFPLAHGSFVWEKPFAIQSHKSFPVQKICGDITQKIFVQNSKSAIHQPAQKATSWQNSEMVREKTPSATRKPPTGKIPTPPKSP